MSAQKRRNNGRKTTITNNNEWATRIINIISGILFPIMLYGLLFDLVKGDYNSVKGWGIASAIFFVIYIATWKENRKIPAWKRVLRAFIFPSIFIFGCAVIGYLRSYQIGKGIACELITIAIIFLYYKLGKDKKDDIKHIKNNETDLGSRKTNNVKYIYKKQKEAEKSHEETMDLPSVSIREKTKEETRVENEIRKLDEVLQDIDLLTKRSPSSESNILNSMPNQLNVERSINQNQISHEVERAQTLYKEVIEQYDGDERDIYFADAGKMIIEKDKASIGMLQRAFNLGFSRAARIMDQLAEAGVVTEEEGTKPRTVLMTMEEFYEVLENDKTADARESAKAEKEKYVNEPQVQLPEEDYQFIDNLDNVLVVSSTDSIIKTIIDGLFNKYPSPVIKTVLLDFEGLTFNQYEASPHLLIPIITDVQKAVPFFNWINNEINHRQDLFVQNHVKDIYTYNNLEKTEQKLSRIVVAIDEIEVLLNNSQSEETLLPILLKSRKVGIHFALFTRFTDKNISLGKSRDLITIIDGNDETQILKEFGYIYSSSSESVTGTESTKTIDEIDKMDGYAFEQFCKNILEANGFYNISVTKQSGDYGADLTAKKDDIRYVIQCKRYSGNVGEDAVREVFTSKNIYGAEIAVVLTNSRFTNQAVVLAKHNSVHLWDRDKLVEMMDAM